VQGPSPKHAPTPSPLSPVVIPPPRYQAVESTSAAPVNAWAKPMGSVSAPLGSSGLGPSLLSSSLGPSSVSASSASAPAHAANDTLSVADPQVTSSGLLSSSAGGQLSSSFQQPSPLQTEPVILPQQASHSLYCSFVCPPLYGKDPSHALDSLSDRPRAGPALGSLNPSAMAVLTVRASLRYKQVLFRCVQLHRLLQRARLRSRQQYLHLKLQMLLRVQVWPILS
jgi:hypothetical protein